MLKCALSLIGLLLGLVGCDEPAGHKYTLTGSSTVAPLAAEIARRYEQRHPGLRIEVQSGGSSRGIADARDGSADIGMVSRALKSEEADLQAITIARDGIALIVHKDNPISDLSREQIIRVFTGKITHWSQLGSNDARIVVVSKAAGRATQAVFCKSFHIQPEDIAAQIIIGDNQEAIKTVAGNPRAIAYVSIGAAEYEINSGAALRMPRIDGISPTTQAVSDGSYPVSRPLNFIIHGTPSPAVQQFIAFARSPEVHDLVSGQFFVPAAP